MQDQGQVGMALFRHESIMYMLHVFGLRRNQGKWTKFQAPGCQALFAGRYSAKDKVKPRSSIHMAGFEKQLLRCILIITTVLN